MMKLPRVREAVHDTPLASAGSRNDTVKLLLLKLHLPGMVTILSALNRRGTAGTVGTVGTAGGAFEKASPTPPQSFKTGNFSRSCIDRGSKQRKSFARRRTD